MSGSSLNHFVSIDPRLHVIMMRMMMVMMMVIIMMKMMYDTVD